MTHDHTLPDRHPPDPDGLNPNQREAVRTTEGPLLVLAGAGTGKTRVIIHRIAQILKQGVDPAHVLAVTFTNKAAKEMRERVGHLLSGPAASAITVGTFHAFCLRVLRTHARRLGYSERFGIADEGYRQGLVRTLMAETGCTGEGRDPGAWLAAISRAKSAMHTPDDIRAAEDLPHAAELATVYALYCERLKDMDQVDFDDLLLLVTRLWQDHPDVLERYRERYRYLLVDEYQDTNQVQFRLVAMLAGPRANICVVGDDDQSIYGWRGADLGNILEFEKHFPGARVIRLEQNYRSTGTILDAANHVISRNRARHAKRLWSQNGPGEPILAVRAEDENEEARFVGDYVAEKKARDGVDYRDIAVLFRGNHQSRALESALRRAKIPYRLVGTNSFYKRKEVLDAIAMLHVVNNPRDDLSLLRVLNVPPRGIGSTTLARLKDIRDLTGIPMQRLLTGDAFSSELTGAARDAVGDFHRAITRCRSDMATPGQLRDKTERLLTDLDYFDGLGRMYKPREDALKRRDNVFEFLNAIAEFETSRGPRASLQEFLESFALVDANDREERNAGDTEDVVTLMTVHAAKGLEFPIVAVVGMERGVFPHRRSIEENGEEEERRLFYVAVTRARRELLLTRAEKRRQRNETLRSRPSPFLDEIPEELIDFRSVADALRPVTKEMADDYMARMKAMFGPPSG